MDMKRTTSLLAVLTTCLCLGGCSLFEDIFDDEGGGYDDGGDQTTAFTEVPGYGEDTWVTDSDILDSDLDLLVDLSVKMDFMQWEFIKMLSNSFEGDRLFCGSGDRSDPDPTVRCFTRLMAHAEEYEAALERLGMSNLMTPTTKGNTVGNLWNIFTAGRTEGQKVREEIQDNLMHMRSGYDQTAQQQLYDFYVEMEPEYAKEIGATDARDFFLKLNNGELDAYAVNIAHVWRDAGIRYADQTGNRVGDYAEAAFTGHIGYLESAYRVSGKVAVSLGELYLTGIDNLAGGYGAKIIELGETIKNKLEALRLAGTILEGKPDWEGMNKYLVNSIMSDVKDAVKDALGGDDMGFGEDVMNQIAENLVDKFSEMCTESSASEAESGEEKDKVEADAEEGDLAILDIYADFGEEAKLILITDDATGTLSMGRPDVHGRLMVATTPGSKTITVTRGNGQRLTRKVVARMGFNTILLKFPQDPYISANYNPILLRFDEKEEYAGVLTNCRYVRISYSVKPDWLDAKIDVFGETIQLIVMAETNLTGAERSATLVLQGFEEKDYSGKPLATCKVVVRQYEQPENGGSISADLLEYGPEGGTQRITVDPGPYAYYGYSIKKEYKEWIQPSLPGDNVIEITVQPNAGAQREAELVCFFTNEENPSDEDKVKFPIRIVQAAGQLVVSDYEINQVSIRPYCYMEGTLDYGYEGLQPGKAIDIRTSDDGVITTSLKNNNTVLHVEAIYKKSFHVDSDHQVGQLAEGDHEYEYSATFDIYNLVNGEGKPVIQNLHVRRYQKYTQTYGEVNSQTNTTDITASNVPYTGNSVFLGYYKGTMEEGVDMSYREEDSATATSYYPGGTWSRSLKYDPTNFIEIYLN